MTRPNLSPLQLDGSEVKLRLQVSRFETCSHVHVDWLRFTCAKRNVVPDVDLLFPEPGRMRDANQWAEKRQDLERQLRAIQAEQDTASCVQALTIARDVAQALGAGHEVNPVADKGHDFYARRWKIERQGKEVGWVGWGASSESPRQRRQAETIHCNLFGAACTFAETGWQGRMAALIDEVDATITRCDLALDFFDGAPFTMEQCRQDLINGVMNVRGRAPAWSILGHWSDEARSHSRSIYIGSRENGKQTNVYEKGHQLFGPESGNPWLRVELRWGNKYRVLPSDMLRRPEAFFAAGGDWHADLLRMAEREVIAAPLTVVDRLADEHADAAVVRVVSWAKSTAGPALNALFRYLSPQQLMEIARVEEQVLPRRLHGYSENQLQSAFDRCSDKYFGRGVQAQAPAMA